MPQVEHLGFSGRAADTPVAASAADVELAAVAADGWPAIETEPLGPWLLRASFGFTLRGNSVLVTGRPQEHLLEAVSSIEAWYAARDLPPIFSLPTDAQGEMTDVALAALLAHRGYQSGEWVMTMTADTAQIIAAGREHPIWDAATPVRVEADLSPDWMAGFAAYRRLPTPKVAEAVLTGSMRQVFVSIPAPELLRSGGVVSANASVLIPAAQRPLAIGRLAMTRRWGGIHAMWVSPAHRRRGLATHLLTTMAALAQERGCGRLYLHVEESNTVARHLYSRFGFTIFNGYRYLQRPPEI